MNQTELRGETRQVVRQGNIPDESAEDQTESDTGGETTLVESGRGRPSWAETGQVRQR